MYFAKNRFKASLLESCSLKPSFYNLSFEINGNKLLFNTLRGTISEVSDELLRAIQQSNIASIPYESLSDLEKSGFLVPAELDELREYLKRYEDSKERGGAIALKLFMATSCNLGCSYCYQSAPTKPGNIIKDEQLKRLLVWLERELRSGSTKSIEIEFYGGEPLLARSLIPQFISNLNHLCNMAGTTASYSIITNGTLLDDGLIALFVQNRVNMQITVDGGRVVHDQRRYWKGKQKGSFDQIVHNLQKIVLAGGADLIRLRMNVDQHNLGEVRSVALLAKQLGIREFRCGAIHFREKQTDYSNNMIPLNTIDSDASLQMFHAMKEFGFSDTPVDLESRTTCMYHWKMGFAVSPNLEFFKCDELIDFPQYSVGRIDEDGNLVLREDEYKKAIQRSPADFKDCTSCRYLPQCGSGCSIRALNVKGTPHVNYCEATYDSIRQKVATFFKADSDGLFQEQMGTPFGDCHSPKPMPVFADSTPTQVIRFYTKRP